MLWLGFHTLRIKKIQKWQNFFRHWEKVWSHKQSSVDSRVRGNLWPLLSGATDMKKMSRTNRGRACPPNPASKWPWLTLEMTKNVDSDPDINQLQFILYQYARACHIVEKTKNLESDLDEFDIKDFVYRKRSFNVHKSGRLPGAFPNFHFRYCTV